MRYIRRIGAIAIAVALIATMSVSAFGVGNQGETKTVRVAVLNYPNFIERDSAGIVSGYAAEYLKDIAAYTGWNYEYVDMPFGDALESLHKGEIDIVAGVQKAPGRDALYDYSAEQMGVNSALLCVSGDDNRYAYEDYEDYNGMKIGGIEGSAYVELCSNFMKEKNVAVTMLTYATDAQAREALDNGQVDALMMGTIRYTADYKVIARLNAVDMYFACNPQDSSIKQGVDEAQTYLHNNYRYYEMGLDQKYFNDIQNSLVFSKNEQDYIATLGTVTLGYVSEQDPVSYVDAKTGEFSGMTRDIFDKISEISGIKFEYVALPEGQIDYQYLVDHNISAITSVEYNEMNLQITSMNLSKPYLKAQKVFVGVVGKLIDENATLTVAMASGSGTIEQYMQSEYPNYSLQQYKSVEESFDAVKKGEADIAMQNQYVVTYLLSKPQYEGLSAIPVGALNDQLSLATVLLKDENGTVQQDSQRLSDPMFINIIDKSIENISEDDVSKIIAKYTTGHPYHMTTGDMMYKYRTQFAIIGVLVAVCMGLFVVLLIIRQKHIAKIEQKNIQLAEAVDQADQANRAKGTFLAQMSHEIRTPMNAIVGLTAIAKNHEQEPEKIDEYLGKIDSSSKVLLNIINDVLDMSAIENEKMKIAKTEFDMKSVLSGISNIYYSQCREKGIRFTMVTDISDELLLGDGLRVNQILLNLVSNAFKFTGKGGEIRVRVFEAQKSENTVFICFEVSDTGIGMTEELKSRLFKPFEQENAMIAQRHGGSGLGLSITKNLIDMMHGAISVKSEKGKGTVFTVELPFETMGYTQKNDIEKLRHLRALVIDDDETALDYTAIVLTRIGVDFDTVESGETAVTMLEQARSENRGYNICFVDWKMPHMDGLEVTRRIRKEFDKDTVIIIVSAYDLAEIEDEAKAAGANMFISKPLFQSTVFNLLMNLTGGEYTKITGDEKQYDFGGKRVLLAEDNALNYEIAMELLHMVNLEVDHAENGAVAVEMFSVAPEGTYGAILMDVQMPVMDGYAAAGAIRELQLPWAKTIPIFAMTANAFDEDVSAALSAGMTGHIAKPIDTEILYKTLWDAFG